MRLSFLINIYFFIGLVMLPVTIYSYFAEGSLFYYLVILEMVFLIPGFLYSTTNLYKKLKKFFYRFINKGIELEKELKKTPDVLLGDVLVVFAFVWLISGILFALPFYFYGIPLVDALFEAFSGITTTGFSVIGPLNQYPSDLLFYRSFLNWLGGLGITGFALTALKGLTGKGFAKVYGVPEDAHIFKYLFVVYLVLTFLGWLLLIGVGLDWFDALNMVFSAISNGGFSHRDDLDLTQAQRIAMGIIMFIGSISMLIYINLLKGKLQLGESFYFYIMVVIALIVMLRYFGGIDWIESMLYVFATITCGGYGYVDYHLNDTATFFLILAMLMGGMLVSTAGGIKAGRILVMLKFVKEQVAKYFRQYSAMSKVRLNNQPLDSHSLNNIISFVFLFVLSYFGLATLLMEYGYGMKDSLFVAASTISNVGASTIDMTYMPDFLKLIIMAFMYIGRIEILPVIALFGKLYLSIKT
ncbi:MAG: TrkH family potassium uptake protein [Candidatus Micrarchaeota archaeon]|nr:TrkH family potassium uptake protein [Candidatus Micrarchaeota archaeon]